MPNRLEDSPVRRRPAPRALPSKAPQRRLARVFLAPLALLVAPALAFAGESGQVFSDWETARGKVVACKDPAEIPEFAWSPVPEEGRVVLYGLGVLRIAAPGDDEVKVKAGRGEVALKPGKIMKFTGSYPGRRRGSVHAVVRKSEQGFEFAVAAALVVKKKTDTWTFVDADGNGVFTDFGIDRMRKGEVKEGEPEPPWEPVPGEAQVDGRRCLLAFKLPDTCLFCPLGEGVPENAGSHNGYLNWIRAYGGLDPTGISMKLYDAQLKHCRYMARNGLCHEEDPARPGYTPEGSAAGAKSVVTGVNEGQTIQEPVASMIWTLYHSYYYIYPRAPTLCYALEKRRYSCFVDSVMPKDFFVFPYPGQDHVQPKGLGEEPDPFPPDAVGRTGTFIRVLCPDVEPLSLEAFRITDLVSGELLEAWHTEPGNLPAALRSYPNPVMKRTICLFPKDPLEAGHVYRVEMMILAFKKTHKIETEFKVG